MNQDTSSSSENQAKPSLETSGIHINQNLIIPYKEILIRATRSSGPGGQHVNKTSSRIELVWSISTSEVLTDEVRSRLTTSLASKLTTDNELRIVVSDTRSQHKNREIAEERFVEVIRKALIVPKTRKPTRPSRQQKQARLDAKSRTSEKKRQRRLPGLED